MTISPYSARSASSGPLIDLLSNHKSPREGDVFSVPHTPYEEDFHVLVKGNYPLEILETLASFFSMKPQGLNVEITEVFTLQDFNGSKTTASHPLVVKVNDQKVAVFKSKQREPGSKAWIARHPDKIAPKFFCTAGTGAFMELVCSLFINQCLQSIPKLQNEIIIPKVAYVQMGHPCFYLRSKTEELSSPLFLVSPISKKSFFLTQAVKGTGALIEYIQNCRACTKADFLQQSSTVQEFIAIMHMLLLNSDAHMGNILISKDQKLVMIDHSYTLSVDGLEGGQFFWIHYSQFERPISELMQQFILNLDREMISNIVKTTQNELLQNLTEIGEENPVEYIEITENRLIDFQIVLQFLKIGMDKGLTILDFASALSQKRMTPRSGLVYDICKDLPSTTTDIEKYIQQACEEKIADLLRHKKENSFSRSANLDFL